MIIVSACLAGIKCRYDGNDNSNEKVIEMIKQGIAIPACPEQLGGLPTPRIPGEILGSCVCSKDGIDVTEQFYKGAAETLKIAKMLHCKKAVLKQRSPSCGFGLIYDGSHTGKIIKGNGIITELLLKNGIKILSEEEL
jgi:uncharacterized protein YbbK (DUF523 family)